MTNYWNVVYVWCSNLLATANCKEFDILVVLQISWFGWAGIFLLLQYMATFHWRDFDLKTTMSSSL